MNKTVILISFLLLCTPLYSIELKWHIPENSRIEIVRTADVRVLTNSRLRKVYKERNIIDLTGTGITAQGNRIKGLFSLYTMKSGTKVFHKNKTYKSRFIISPSGRYHVRKKYIMPNQRNIPRFPKKDIKIGESWKRKGLLVIYEFSRPITLVFDVTYKLQKVVKRGNDRIALISYKYFINRKMPHKRPGDFPFRIIGQNRGNLFWNITKKAPEYSSDIYRIAFAFRRGRRLQILEFRMNLKTQNRIYRKVSNQKKENDKKDLQKKVPKDITVDIHKKGLVLRLGDVHFDFDSYSLRNDTRKKLKKVMNIIKKKYSDREIIVEGYTDNIGTRTYNKKLSKKRARKVALFIKRFMKHDKLSYRGKGSSNPIRSNKTARGRRLNRRVEIIIKLN